MDRLRGRAMRWRTRDERRATLIVLVGMSLFVAGVYVAVVLGLGAVVGRTDHPHVGLSILATAVVALAFDPVQSRLARFGARLVYGDRLTPYEALSRFSRSVTGAYAAEELPARMAMVLAEGTGAATAQVWLKVDDGLSLAATWPPGGVAADGEPPTLQAHAQPEGVHVQHVLDGDELLGVLRVQEQARQPLTPVEERLFRRLAAQAGLALRGARLRAELGRRAEELAARAADLRASRERLVAAQDEARRRLERDIHDGAQQHLVALAVNLRLAETLASRSSERAVQVLRQQVKAAEEAIRTVTELSRGIYPRVLEEEGLLPALEAASAASPVPVQVTGETRRRYARPVEAALYFISLEAMQNAAKHARASLVQVTLRDIEDRLELLVEDDGRGLAADLVAEGTGLASMRDRLDAVGGTLHLSTSAIGGVAVRGVVPVQRARGDVR